MVRVAKRPLKQYRTSKPKRQKTSEAVKKYVKATLSRTLEKKELIFRRDANDCLFNEIKSFNIMYTALTRGTGEANQFIGNQVKIKSMQLKVSVTNISSTVGVPGPTPSTVVWTVGIVGTKVFRTLTSLLKEELFDENITLGTNLVDYYRDSDKCKWLAKKTIRINPHPSDRTIGMHNEKTLFKRKDINFRFRDFDSSFEAEKMNYYIVFIPHSQYSNNSTILGLQSAFSFRMSFQDA